MVWNLLRKMHRMRRLKKLNKQSVKALCVIQGAFFMEESFELREKPAGICGWFYYLRDPVEPGIVLVID